MSRPLDSTRTGAAPQVSVRLSVELLGAVEGERVRLQSVCPPGMVVSVADAVRAVLTRALLPPTADAPSATAARDRATPGAVASSPGASPRRRATDRPKAPRAAPPADGPPPNLDALRKSLAAQAKDERTRKVPRAQLRFSQRRVAAAIGTSGGAVAKFIEGGGLSDVAARRLAVYLAGG